MAQVNIGSGQYLAASETDIVLNARTIRLSFANYDGHNVGDVVNIHLKDEQAAKYFRAELEYLISRLPALPAEFSAAPR